MKQDKLFEDCLSKIDPEDRGYVRTQMEYKLMGLPTDEELEEWYEDMASQSSARYIRNLAAQKLKEQKARDIKKACEYLKRKCDYLDGECILHLDFNLEEFKKAMEG